MRWWPEGLLLLAKSVRVSYQSLEDVAGRNLEAVLLRFHLMFSFHTFINCVTLRWSSLGRPQPLVPFHTPQPPPRKFPSDVAHPRLICSLYVDATRGQVFSSTPLLYICVFAVSARAAVQSSCMCFHTASTAITPFVWLMTWAGGSTGVEHGGDTLASHVRLCHLHYIICFASDCGLTAAINGAHFEKKNLFCNYGNLGRLDSEFEYLV